MPAANAQDPECDERIGWWGRWRSGPRAHVCEIRELTLPASGALAVDASPNGGISVTGEDRTDLQVRAVLQAWGRDDAHLWAGRAAMKLKRYADARDAYRKALEVNPANAWVRGQLLPEVEKAMTSASASAK